MSFQRKRILIGVFLFYAIIITFTFPGECNDLHKRFGLGLGYPYLSLKYGLTSHLTLEPRGAFGKGIVTAGGRLYWNFTPKSRIVLYSGLEANYVSFDKENTSGNGYLTEFFLGAETFLTDKITFIIDIGPGYTKLAESGSDYTTEGLDWILNIGLNFYFYKLK